jgi:hypothetical protein
MAEERIDDNTHDTHASVDRREEAGLGEEDDEILEEVVWVRPVEIDEDEEADLDVVAG